jgi:hypothetical protein
MSSPRVQAWHRVFAAGDAVIAGKRFLERCSGLQSSSHNFGEANDDTV